MARLWAGFLTAMMLTGCDGGSGTYTPPAGSPPLHAEFRGEKAFEHVKAQVDLGPRPAGGVAIEKTRVYLEQQLAAVGWATQRQAFKAPTPSGEVEFVNLRARFGKDASWDKPVRILVGSHYDTKRFTDFRFVGANDGASSTGALVEIARVAATQPAFAQRLELIFFDGEEAFVSYTATDGLYGSRHYARTITRRQSASQRPRAMVVLDMIGEKDVYIQVPSDSDPKLMELLFASARELGTEKHFGVWNSPILDDHEPFQREGIPAIDLIDLAYPSWHTSRDTIEQVSPGSLEITGRTALAFLVKLMAE